MSTDTIVEATGIHKRFGSVTALNGVDLALVRGEVLALLGPNGSGKTTTVRILATLLRPDGGRATVAGYDVLQQADKVRRLISLTGQYASVDEQLTGRENLVMLAGLLRLPKAQRRSIVEGLLADFDLAEAAGRHVSTYSGGMRRRLDLAASLLIRPQVLFLDEPTTGLDPRSRQQMWETIRHIVADGTSVLLTTQYLEEADRLADRIVLLDEGQVVAEGRAEELKSRVGQAYVELRLPNRTEAARARAILADMNHRRSDVRNEARDEAFAADKVLVPTDGGIADVGKILYRVESAGLAVDEWQVRTPSLDDVFIALTGRVSRTPLPAEPTDSSPQEAA